MADLPSSPAADRNKQPILEVLSRTFGARGTALEIAAGTGQHATWFAAALPEWVWQPTEADARMLPLLAADHGRPAACPHCGSRDVEELAGFGSTACKALWRCTSCREPFDYVKAH